MQSLKLSYCILAACLLLCPVACGLKLAQEQKTSMTVSTHRLQLRARVNTTDPAVANLTLYFFPGPALYGIVEEQTVNLTFDYHLESPVDLRATFFVADPSIAELSSAAENWTTLVLRRDHSPDQRLLQTPDNITAGPLRHQLQLLGVFLGRTTLQLRVQMTAESDANTNLVMTTADGRSFQYQLSVVRYLRTIDKVFRTVVWVFVLFANVGMGCEIDLKIVKDVLRRPVAPIIGLVSQYLFMPMISFCVLLLIDIPASTALGYFGIGCAPGGGASNFYCLLLGGDVSLSITMTVLSTVAALGMVPMYMFTLGQQVLKSRDININIPYWNILLTLVLILVPTAIGFVIERRLPRLGRLLRRILKPVLIGFILFMFTVGFYANLFILKLFTPGMILAGCSLPYLGFIFGALLAAVFCQGYQKTITIALETMIQNAGVPILILQASLPQPEADLSLVGPIAAMTFTPLPLFIWLIVLLIRQRLCGVKEAADKDGDSKGNEDVEMEVEEPKTQQLRGAGEAGVDANSEEAEKFLPKIRARNLN